MEWRLFADLAEAAGDRRVTVDVADGATVGDALDALLKSHPPLQERLFDDSGSLYDHINILRNGENIMVGDGLDTPVDSDDELAVFPPVSGG